ncbi:hypothetical protein GCM10022214_81390 [Actinomadura miaoliensis]|uniref:Uncharacterized protein n=1 Tax=Actinomadura miaoliensis TaxID=430685 RepID=A0ABP7X3A5_9ACTN
MAALAAHLDAHRFAVKLTNEDCGCGTRTRRGADNPVLSDMIRCRRRSEDGGRLWLFDSAWGPIAEADRLEDAVVWVKGRLTPRDVAERQS